ncbi:MAG: glucose-6-phosphate dehydrogenase [Bacteroidetes bacterium CG18_big_fil_WC_8_21_14_2_50_41_14]|nr:MAG: glucose-6-phosphate dehydrogenase [Bacteroidetes bacterium CG18_big_fil_WC_8_21_14_2_50_41_14]
MKSNDNHIYVIFGASGDLTKRKLVPALYSLFVQNLLPEKFTLLGVSRSQFSDAEFKIAMESAISEFKEIDDTTRIPEFIAKIHYQSIGFDDVSTYLLLKQRLEALRVENEISGNTVFYMSTPPSLYGIIPQHLASVGLNAQDDGWKRLIIEKPFGYDLESALILKDQLLKDWQEEQLFRIDHYLGKETVQNLMVTRFSNGIFEPLWNRNYIDHVEITSAESIGVEKRGGYYESSGALRDMVQNHLLQVAAITAMESPSSLEPVAIRNEILKVFQSLRPIKREDVKTNAIRGQYLSSTIKDEHIAGYREEEGVHPESVTETYAAIKFYIDNWRWGGVPFYIRSGKRLPTRVTEVVIHFKPTPHFLFSSGSVCSSCNQLVIRIQPDEGVLLKFGMKTPGAGFDVQNVNMDFHYSDLSHQRMPSAYERLIYDSMKGDATLFARTQEVIEAWKFLAPVIDCWKNDREVPLYGYPAGSWGPESADDLIENKEMTWRYPCKNLSDDGIYCEL